jgi:outer membrane lipoprotein LolB
VFLRQFALPLILLFLAGCATQPGPGSDGDTWQQHQAALASLTHWSATGKIALRNSTRSESGNMSWSQRDLTSELILSGPLGLNTTTLQSDGQLLVINDGQQTRQFDLSLDEVIATETGWDLPVQALHFWLKGMPAPALDIQMLELDAGRIKRLQQSDWTITVERYQQFGQIILPTKLRIERADTRARIIIQKWVQESAG